MNKPVLHVFRNTPFGRETLLQSAFFCRRLRLPLAIYTPQHKRFLFYFDSDVVQVDLDASYLNDPQTAAGHIDEILSLHQLSYQKVKPKGMSASNLPDLPSHFSVMTCPRSMSDEMRKIALGHIGSKVRKIVQMASFPIFLPTAVFKPWTRLAVLYGGSDNAAGALRLACEIRRRTNTPLQVFSQGARSELAARLLEQGFSKEQIEDFEWIFFAAGDIAPQLYMLPHDALVLLGAYGNRGIRETLFGSTMEKVQAGVPNSLLVVGPKCRWAGGEG